MGAADRDGDEKGGWMVMKNNHDDGKLDAFNLVAEIMFLSVLVSTKTKSQSFCEFSGHIGVFNTKIFLCGWSPSNEADISGEIHLSEPQYAWDSWEKRLNRLESCKETLIKILKDEEINFEDYHYQIEEVKHYYF
jgi:hypothetical protein